MLLGQQDGTLPADGDVCTRSWSLIWRLGKIDLLWPLNRPRFYWARESLLRRRCWTHLQGRYNRNHRDLCRFFLFFLSGRLQPAWANKLVVVTEGCLKKIHTSICRRPFPTEQGESTSSKWTKINDLNWNEKPLVTHKVWGEWRLLCDVQISGGWARYVS